MRFNEVLWEIWKRRRTYCLKKVLQENESEWFKSIIRDCNVNLLEQYTDDSPNQGDEKYKEYFVTKLINQHAFQAGFTERAIKRLVKYGLLSREETLVLVDIGDSAGNHLKYQRMLLTDLFENIHSVSVNLDPVAVEKVRKGGGEAVLCRAEDYKPDGLDVSVYLSYEMVEHLHNPSVFFYRLAKSNNGRFMVVTVPYRRKSCVAVAESMDYENYDRITAEEEHIFELSPNDWKKLIWHSGWKVISEEIYYQYPRNSVLSPLYRRAWELCDFEGFYAMLLERDMSAAEKYTDWED